MKLARGFSRQHRIIHFTTIGSASGLRLLPGGFTYLTSYTLTPGQPPPGMDYLPASPHHSPTTGLVRRLHHSAPLNTGCVPAAPPPPHHPERRARCHRIHIPGVKFGRSRRGTEKPPGFPI